MPKTLAIVQARMSSSRLPGKVLMDIAGQPMLMRVIERVRKARTLDGIAIATTTDSSDDPIEQMCTEQGYPCYRGSQQDVLDRYYQAARIFSADVIVRITGDCPVIDPDIIDMTVKIFLKESGPGFVATRLPPPWHRTIPIGLDVEVVGFSSLALACKEADQPFHREHVMPFFYEGTPSDILKLGQSPGTLELQEEWSVTHSTSLRGFKVAVLNHTPDYGMMRWTVDTADDLMLIREIFTIFADREHFSWQEILALFQNESNLGMINSTVRHKDFRESEHQQANKDD